MHGTKEAASIVLPWKLAAAVEYARATGQVAISVMLDLEKAFEKFLTACCDGSRIIICFSLLILRWLIAVYS